MKLFKKNSKFIAVLLSTLSVLSATATFTGASDNKEKDIIKTNCETEPFPRCKFYSTNYSFIYESEYYLRQEILKIVNREELLIIEEFTLRSIIEMFGNYPDELISIADCCHLLSIELSRIYISYSVKEPTSAIIRYNNYLCTRNIPPKSKKFLTDISYIFLVMRDTNLSQKSRCNICRELKKNLYNILAENESKDLFPTLKKCFNELLKKENTK